jgi:drug/metabolite transporter (DMT)-like permease
MILDSGKFKALATSHRSGHILFAILASDSSPTAPAATPVSKTPVLALGVGPVGAALLLWNFGMKRGDPRLLGALAYATPVVSTIISRK